MKIGMTFNVKSAPKSADAGFTSPDDEEEFDSPETIDAIASALRELGHDVELLGEGEPMLRRLLNGDRPELVFNFAEGRGIGRCREARVPAVLEMLNIPYTGSDPLTLAATLDKECAKRLVASAGVATPKWVLVAKAEGGRRKAEKEEESDAQSPDFRPPPSAFASIPLPAIVKPAFEGSSKGIFDASVAFDYEQLASTVERVLGMYRQPVLVEEYIEGDELTVGVTGNAPPEVLGIMRVIPVQQQGPFVYSIEVKRDWQRRVRYECPAQLSPADTNVVEQAALASYQALSCRDVARIDFRLRGGTPYFLEANPLPGLSPQSGDLVLLARGVGVSHQQLIARIVDSATARWLQSAQLSSCLSRDPS